VGERGVDAQRQPELPLLRDDFTASCKPEGKGEGKVSAKRGTSRRKCRRTSTDVRVLVEGFPEIYEGGKELAGGEESRGRRKMANSLRAGEKG
jgi:hypothetical protein